ncbi:LapD/MoxY N-terminal periplasmic domain-containing protein [Klebsiella sp. BIGb0407]|uniref:bifunctional diguanylate cyclase/phosphodiesterase n=1 Tax=Klebsiella sp. BIGb0407 TaxID=2940603 RepID=UPI00216A8AF4|nr:LapD/MoxY N-terminal periplasmic domain-containing protein [Klebsiella sp. BIGb0407]MCS3434397.1 EAL domain-containing protein (putative c-di-GMP-specific phosphodiesterase class I)/GGDEF domain-containing protein [Klebsiella sp. BIGb0407]
MSLYKQLLIGICLFALAIFCGSFYVTVENSRVQFHNQLNAHAQDTATALGLSLTTNIDDPVMTELMVNSIFDSGYFSRIEVIDINTGKPLIERHNTPQSSDVPDWFIRLVRLDPGMGEAVVMRGWTQVARVEVMSHPIFMLTRLWESVVASFLMLSACSIICVLAARFMLRRCLRPLNYIVKQAMAISQREFIFLPIFPKTPELRRVVDATNMMVTQLKALFSEQAVRTEILRQEAYNDSLTGLNNRRAFDIHLQSRLSDEEQTSGHLILLRVQDLTGLNQRIGGGKTDALLIAIADILNDLQQEFFHNEGFLARVRGGEFAIITSSVLPQEMEGLVARLTHQLKILHETGMGDITPLAHIAQVIFNTGDTPNVVLFKADQALAMAQTEMSFFASSQISQKVENDDDLYRWRNRLESTLENNGFQLFSQPVYQCNDNKVILHHKILARIKTEEGEMIPAGRFMPWIHRLALSRRMDIVMLKQTLLAMEKNTQPMALSISGESVADEASIDALLKPLKNVSHLASRLTLELDENELPDPDHVSILVKKLKVSGCHLGIQHFGGRFHLIGNLPQWGLAWIKVDGGYIRNIDKEEDKKLFIEAIYWATRQVNLPLIAERVETEGELAVLEKMGLYGAMGRYFSDASTLTK